MKIFLLFYMFHFAIGLTHCYKTAVSLQYIYFIIQHKDFYNGLQSFMNDGYLQHNIVDYDSRAQTTLTG